MWVSAWSAGGHLVGAWIFLKPQRLLTHTSATRLGQRPDPQKDVALGTERGHDGASASPQLPRDRGLGCSRIFLSAQRKWGVGEGGGLYPACPEEGGPCAARWESDWEFTPTPTRYPQVPHKPGRKQTLCPRPPTHTIPHLPAGDIRSYGKWKTGDASSAPTSRTKHMVQRETGRGTEWVDLSLFYALTYSCLQSVLLGKLKKKKKGLV